MASPKDPSAKEEEGGGKKLGTRKVCKLPAAAGGLPKLHQSPSHFGPDTDRWESAFDLLGILRRLHQDECRRFRCELRKIPIRKGYVQIPEKALQEADASDLVELLFSYYGETYAVEVAADGLRAIGCEHQADELRGRKRAVYSSRGTQRNVGKKKVWSLEGVVITGEVMIRKGKKELLEIVEKDLGYFLHLSYSEFIITWREYCVFQIKRGNSKEKSEKLLTMIQERGETTCCWFLEHVEKKHAGSVRILLYAATWLRPKIGPGF